MVYQLPRNLTPQQIKDSGFDTYFVDHTTAVYPIAASGLPWSAEQIQATGDIIADLHEDLAAEQKARVTYDNLIRLIDDPDVLDPLRFLREREIVHYQRFGDANRTVLKKSKEKNGTIKGAVRQDSPLFFLFCFVDFACVVAEFKCSKQLRSYHPHVYIFYLSIRRTLPFSRQSLQSSIFSRKP